MFKSIKTWLVRFIHSSIYKPGHYYSPIADYKEVKSRELILFSQDVKVHDVNIMSKPQSDRLANFIKYKLEFKNLFDRSESRYHPDNGFFNYSDGFYLYGMMRDLKPKRIIEVGSGHSSALMLDINEMYFDGAIELSFVEPFPERLNTLLKNGDKDCEIIIKKVQEVNLEKFNQLEQHDMLFIDSSHVSKVGSDVNFLIFNVLPILKPGVIIHFHDITWPFEYPKEWIYEGRYWNEAYLLRAFLMNNNNYEILLFNSYLAHYHQGWLKEQTPECSVPGGSLYLRKLK